MILLPQVQKKSSLDACRLTLYATQEFGGRVRVVEVAAARLGRTAPSASWRAVGPCRWRLWMRSGCRRRLPAASVLISGGGSRCASEAAWGGRAGCLALAVRLDP